MSPRGQNSTKDERGGLTTPPDIVLQQTPDRLSDDEDTISRNSGVEDKKNRSMIVEHLGENVLHRSSHNGQF